MVSFYGAAGWRVVVRRVLVLVLVLVRRVAVPRRAVVVLRALVARVPVFFVVARRGAVRGLAPFAP